MKIGVKIYRYVKGIEEFAKIVDFIEIMALEGENYSKFEKLGIPIIIHAQHHRHGVNNADKTKDEKNNSSINFAINLADTLNADKIIVHPGELDSEDCSRENAVSFIKNLKDSRILVENMPQKEGLCVDAGGTREFLIETGNGFCFDANHAIKEELSLKKDYFKKIESFLKLNPNHYHLGGQNFSGGEHINFKYSEIDLKKIIGMFPNDAEISIETSGDMNLDSLKEDVILLREIVNSRT